MSTTSSSHRPRTKPPTTLHPTCTIDTNASLFGTYPITISAGAVIHPRARLVSTHAPITVGEGVVVCERGYVGIGVLGLDGSEPPRGREAEVGVTLEKGVVVEPQAVVEAESIGEGTALEAGCKVGRGVVVGMVSLIGFLFAISDCYC